MTMREQLVRDEGVVFHAYQDHLGFWTIGVGRSIDSKKGGGITREEALYLLDNDIGKKRVDLLAVLPWTATLAATDEARFAVLLNMAFNLGVAGLLGFRKMIEAVRDGNYDRAAKEMLDSEWALQVGLRAQRLAEQMQTGEWL